MPIRTGGTAPYAPPATVLYVVNALRDRGLTTPITGDVLLRAGISDSLVPRVLRSLIGLELVDEDGKLTPAMDGLRRVPSAEFKTRLTEHVRGVYEEVFNFTDPAKDDIKRITDAFRAYEPMGQRTRMVTLFMGLCEAAGIIPEGATRKATVVASGGSGRKPAAPVKRQAERQKSDPPPAAVATGLPSSIPPVLAGMLHNIPPNGTGWTQADRDRWLTLFGQILDYTIPIRQATVTLGPPPVEDDDEEV
jgi:hypothetical protein